MHRIAADSRRRLGGPVELRDVAAVEAFVVPVVVVAVANRWDQMLSWRIVGCFGCLLSANE